MSVLEAFLTATEGFLIAWVLFDWGQRRALEKRLVEADQGMRELLANVQKVHNSLAEQVQKLQDQVNAHEFKLSGKSK